MLKIIIEGPSGSGKTRLSRIIQMAIIFDPKFKTEKFSFKNVIIFDGDEKLKGKPKIAIITKQSE
jgi:ABC-type lipoprotein export system ATPase subunit